MLIIFFTAFIFATVRFGPSVTRLIGNPARFRDLIDSYGYKGVAVFVFFQVLQIVVAAIPGEVVQLAGGYIYGTYLGTLYLLIGVIIGSVIVFYLSRLLGYSLVRKFVPEKRLQKFNFMVNCTKSEITMFILFLIPGFPKDMLTYIAGLTPVKPLRFIVIATSARLPALFVSAYIGSNLHGKNYPAVIVLSSAAVILFAAGALLREKLIERLQSLLNPQKS